MIRYVVTCSYKDASGSRKKVQFNLYGTDTDDVSVKATRVLEAGGNTEVTISSVTVRPLIRGMFPKFSFN